MAQKKYPTVNLAALRLDGDDAKPSSKLCTPDTVPASTDTSPSTQIELADQDQDDHEDDDADSVVEVVPSKCKGSRQSQKNINRTAVHIDDYVSRDAQSINVKTLRCLVPQLLILVLFGKDGLSRKKKHKGLWEPSNRPNDWPRNLEFKDPNNKPKMSQYDLRRTYDYLRAKYLMMYQKPAGVRPIPGSLLTTQTSQAPPEVQTMPEPAEFMTTSAVVQPTVQGAAREQPVAQNTMTGPNQQPQQWFSATSTPATIQASEPSLPVPQGTVLFQGTSDEDYTQSVMSPHLLASTTHLTQEVPAPGMNTHPMSTHTAMQPVGSMEAPTAPGENYLNILERRTTEKLTELRRICKSQPQVVAKYELALQEIIVPMFQQALGDKQKVRELVDIIHKVERPIDMILITKDSTDTEDIISELEQIIVDHAGSPNLDMENVKMEVEDDRKVPEVGMEVQIYMVHESPRPASLPTKEQAPYFPPLLSSALKQSHTLKPKADDLELEEIDSDFDLSEFLKSIDGKEVCKPTTEGPVTEKGGMDWVMSPASTLSGKLNNMTLAKENLEPKTAEPAVTSFEQLGIQLVNVDHEETLPVVIKQEPEDVAECQTDMGFTPGEVKLEELQPDDEAYLQMMVPGVIDLQQAPVVAEATQPNQGDFSSFMKAQVSQETNLDIKQELGVHSVDELDVSEIELINLVDDLIKDYEDQPDDCQITGEHLTQSSDQTQLMKGAILDVNFPKPLLSPGDAADSSAGCRPSGMLNAGYDDAYWDTTHCTVSGEQPHTDTKAVPLIQAPSQTMSPPPQPDISNIPTTVLQFVDDDMELGVKRKPPRRSSKDATRRVSGGKVTMPKKRGRPRKHPYPMSPAE